MKKRNFTQAVMWITAFLPIFIAAVLYSRLPDRIPLHWSIDGTVGSYGSRIALLGLSCIGLLCTILCRVLRRFDPKHENYARFSNAYDTVFIALNLVFLAMTLFTTAQAVYPGSISAQTFVCTVIGFLFVVIGNLMPKFKHNYFLGIRTPWTLASETVWYHTHRLSGIVWFLGGLLIILSGFLPPQIGTVVLIVDIVVLIAVPTAASYLWYRKER